MWIFFLPSLLLSKYQRGKPISGTQILSLTLLEPSHMQIFYSQTVGFASRSLLQPTYLRGFNLILFPQILYYILGVPTPLTHWFL
jgi:hypothetical protein